MESLTRFPHFEGSDASAAQAAIQGVNGTDLGGRTLNVNEARPRGDGRGGGGGRRPPGVAWIPGACPGVDPFRQANVLVDAQGGEQVETLENKTDFLSPKLGSLPIVHRREILPHEEDTSLGRCQKSPNDVKQGRLSRTRASHDGDELAFADLQVHAAERSNGDVSHLIVLFEPDRLQTNRRDRTLSQR